MDGEICYFRQFNVHFWSKLVVPRLDFKDYDYIILISKLSFLNNFIRSNNDTQLMKDLAIVFTNFPCACNFVCFLI